MWSNWASQCAFGANQERLYTQRPDQLWVDELLPMRNQAQYDRRTEDVRYGGLFGELGILLGLLALSVKPSNVDAAVQRAVRDVTLPDGGWRRHNLAHQPRKYILKSLSPLSPLTHYTTLGLDRRGVLVKIWSYPPYSTSATLGQLEVGSYGKIYR